MKKLISFSFLFFLVFQGFSQETVKINVAGISDQVAEKLRANRDRVSWYTLSNTSTIASNLVVTLKNTDQNGSDKGRMGVKADPGADGKYALAAEVEVKLKKVDKTKPIAYEITLETILGNEIFAVGVVDAAGLTKPIVLDKYMWRASNEKIAPEKKLCLAFAAYIEDATQRAAYAQNEGELKFDRSAFALSLKQDGVADWINSTETMQGSLSNGNALAMTAPLPDWINTSKPLNVRFSVKTPKGNFIWAEYKVNPNEYRKEVRATHYTRVAFDPNTPVGASSTGTQAPATQPASVNSTPTVTPVAPASDSLKKESTPKQVVKPSGVSRGVAPTKTYAQVLAEADRAFAEGKFSEAKVKYQNASAMKPEEAYPKQKIAECDQKLSNAPTKGQPTKGSPK